MQRMPVRRLGPGLGILAGLALTVIANAAAVPALPRPAERVLFIGNSFDFGSGSAVRFYRSATVTDLNDQGTGGVPALFQSFAAQSGLAYEVALETEPGVGLDWHLAHKRTVIGRQAWDLVVMHGYSTLDQSKPGDPALLVATVRQMSEFLRTKNAQVNLRLIATWPRADQVYESGGAWHGKSVEAMAHDLRAAYDQAAAATGGVRSVIPVGEAWIRAMQQGIADSNPFDGIDAGKLNLWTYDSYHASTYGYYLDALMIYGSITGRDPRSLGANECSGFELGLSTAQVGALQQIAYEQLAAAGLVTTAAQRAPGAEKPSRCR